jgi:aldehyde:ferredoxin oxidoreductase
MDSITAGSTIAWAMEAFEKGDLTKEDTGGIPLNWGDVDTVIHKVLPIIARREGKLGELLADGSVAAAKKLGRGIEYTTHSKGLEAPMHDPRGGGHGMALTYAVGARGACHVSDPMLVIEFGAKYYPEIGFAYELEPRSDKYKPEAAVVSIVIGVLENSTCFCNFADALTIPDWLNLFNDVAGYGYDIEELMKAGRRVFYLKRLINYRYGLTAKDDALTPRMLEPARDGEPEGIEINFESMKQGFYNLMGFDSVKGIPTKEKLSEHGMEEEAKQVW